MLIGECKPEIHESRRNYFKLYTTTRDGFLLLILLTSFVVETHCVFCEIRNQYLNTV
jgi:hypothetical protein